jgi:hypothetical protein
VQYLTLFVFPDLKDDRIQAFTYPADGHILFRNVGQLIEPIGLGEQFPRLLKPNATPGIRSEPPALAGIEAKAHLI